MNNLKIAIPVLILFILIVAGVYYAYQAQVSNKADLILNASPDPIGNLKDSTPSAGPKGAVSGDQSTTPKTGPEDGMSLATTISLSSPAQASTISSPIQVQGFANITSQVVEIQIKDSNNKILGSGRASACIGYTACSFSANVVFSQPQTPTGSIVAFSKSTIDNSPVNVTSLSINFN